MTRLHSRIRYMFAVIAASAAGLILGHMAAAIYDSAIY